MRHCCCCIGLRTGSVLVGIIFLLVAAAALVWSALGVSDNIQAWPDVFTRHVEPRHLEIALYVILAVAAMSVLCDLLLLYGAVRHSRCGLLCWLLWTGLVLFLATGGLLVLLALAIWLMVDDSAPEKLGWRQDIWSDTLNTLGLSPEDRRAAERHNFLVLLISTIVALVVVCILWGWYSAVEAYYRRLRHTTVVVKTQYVHTSRL